MRHFILSGILLGLVFLFVGCSQEKPLNYGPYSIGRDPSWFPLQPEELTPNLTAFSTSLIKKIAQEEQIPLRIVSVDWVQLYSSLEKKEVGGIFSALSPNLLSQERYSFSDPFLLLGPVLIVPTTSPVTSLADLDGKIVGVNQYDDSVLIVQRYPSIIIKLYESMPGILEDLNLGIVDAAVIADLTS